MLFFWVMTSCRFAGKYQGFGGKDVSIFRAETLVSTCESTQPRRKAPQLSGAGQPEIPHGDTTFTKRNTYYPYSALILNLSI
jgi:hypothetical protein